MAFDRVLISACLLGRKVRYDGSDKLSGSPALSRWQAEGRLVPLCPEVAAGFPTPRPPAEIVGGGDGSAVLTGAAEVVEDNGRRVTDLYLEAGRIAVDLALREGCRFALLTDGSPSCGSSFIYDGSFSGARVRGRGTTTAALEAAGVRVFSELQIEELGELLDREE
jgi:uncharacterized protein YbbK (DUF523 family)